MTAYLMIINVHINSTSWSTTGPNAKLLTNTTLKYKNIFFIIKIYQILYYLRGEANLGLSDPCLIQAKTDLGTPYNHCNYNNT